MAEPDMDHDDGDSTKPSIVPPAQKTNWGSYIKQLMVASGDLASLTAPAFLLSGSSILEHETSYHYYPQIFAEINHGKDPTERMLLVVKWWIASLWANFGAPFDIHSNSSSVKKPYNPILGEQFHCYWDDPSSEWKHVAMTAEQVSHHPPVSAFIFESKEMGMYINGSILTKTRFRGTSVRVENYGEVILALERHQEEYRITYPEMHLRGMLSGKIFIEITGESLITSNSGLTGHIDHIGKGWFVGEYHALKGSVYHTEEPDVPLYNINGKWTDKTYAVHAKTKEQTLLSDVQHWEVVHPKFKPIEQQSDLESLKVWKTVTEALRAEDYQKATQEKTLIEETQRSLRRQREIDSEVWKPVYFHQTPEDELPDQDMKEKDRVSYWKANTFPKIIKKQANEN